MTCRRKRRSRHVALQSNRTIECFHFRIRVAVHEIVTRIDDVSKDRETGERQVITIFVVVVIVHGARRHTVRDHRNDDDVNEERQIDDLNDAWR